MSDIRDSLTAKAAEFIDARDALAATRDLAAVNSSKPIQQRLSLMDRRALKLQSGIERIGKTIDGGRRWFVDTFGADVEDSVPLASPAIKGAAQSAIAAMNYFIRDAKSLHDGIVQREQNYQALSDDQKNRFLGAAETGTADDPMVLPEIEVTASALPSFKWVWLAGAVLLFYVAHRHGKD